MLQQDKLKEYQEYVFHWEKKTDLIGGCDKNIFFQRHIINSLNILPLLQDNDLLIHDVGTGAGLPGIVCRLCDDNLERHYALYEKKYQKRSFLKNIIIKLNLKNISVHEKYPDVSRETSDIIVSRALFSLNDLIDYKSNFKKFILFKGKNYMDEFKGLKKIVKKDKVKIYKIISDDSYLLTGVSNDCFT